MVVATVRSTSWGSLTYSPRKKSSASIPSASRRRRAAATAASAPAGTLPATSSSKLDLLDPLVDPVDVLLGELPVEGGEELVLHRLQVAAQEADQGREVPPAPGVVVDAAAEAGVVVQHPGHLALQLVAVVGEPAHQPRVDPGQRARPRDRAPIRSARRWGTTTSCR